MLKAEGDSVINRLTSEDRQNLRRVTAAIREARGGSPDAARNGGRITARELLEGWPEELPGEVRTALEAILARDETGPKVGEAAPGLFPQAIGVRGAGTPVRFSRPVAGGRWPWPSAAALDPLSALRLSA